MGASSHLCASHQWRAIFGRVPHTPPQIQKWATKFPSTGLSIANRSRQGDKHPHQASPYLIACIKQADSMTETLDYVKVCESCPSGDGWGPAVTTETTLNGVPYAPFSKGDKLGRMADWTSEGKDRDRGRNQYNRNYRGSFKSCERRPAHRLLCNQMGMCVVAMDEEADNLRQTSRPMAPATPSPSAHPLPRTSRVSLWSATPGTRPNRDTDEVLSLRAAVASVAVDEAMLAEDDSNSNVPPVAAGDTAAMTVAVAPTQAAVVVVASAGRTTTSLRATVTPALPSRLTGSCWRRLTLTAWLS